MFLFLFLTNHPAIQPLVEFGPFNKALIDFPFRERYNKEKCGRGCNERVHNMKIYNHIVTDYLAGKDIKAHEPEWFFHQPGYCFEMPDVSDEKREAVREVYEQTLHTAEQFVPGNRAVWDALFPGWEEILERTTVALIIGYPEPNDATVMPDPQGGYTAVLDMGLWTKYLGACSIGSLVQNLLTHELCHVCIHALLPGLDAAWLGGGYIDRLDAFTFDEGLAHFVSYEGKEASEIDWDSELLRDVWRRSSAEMERALAEADAEKQADFLERAIFGDYYDKYACMCGMMYLAQCWKEGGTERLAEEFAAGFAGFAEKAVCV